MKLATLDDAALLTLIIAEEPDALGELYDRYHRLVYSLALHIVGDRRIAEELTVEIFNTVWQKAAQYKGERAKFVTWLGRITRNRAIDELRRQKVRPERTSVSWSELAAGDNALKSGERNDPAFQAELAWQQRRIRQALAELPEAQRQALMMAYFDGYSQRQIANLLDLPVGTIKTRIRLAMDKLRLMLQDYALPMTTISASDAGVPHEHDV